MQDDWRTAPVPDGWSSRPITELVDFPSGQVDPRHEPYRSMVLAAPDHIQSTTGNLLFKVSAASQGAISGKYLFAPGDVVYSKIRPYLRKAFLADFEGLSSADMYPLRPRAGVDARFLLAVLLGESFSRFAEIVSMRSGFPKINREEFAEYVASIPGLPEQRRIADVLGTLDETIRKTEQLIAKLKQVKRGLLHDLLTRGIDENGELRDPEQHPEQFERSPLGRLPKEWGVLPVERLLADVDPAMRSGPFGSALLKSELVESGVPLLGIDNVYVERFFPTFARFVTAAKFNELIRYQVRPGDVLITIMGTVGRCCLVPENIGPALSSKHIWTLTFDKERYSPLLACLQLNYAPWVLRHFRRDEQGGIMSAIRSETLRTALLPVPNRAEMREIEERLSTVTLRIEKEEAGFAKLRLLRHGLMDDLLTGRVPVTPLLAESSP